MEANLMSHRLTQPSIKLRAKPWKPLLASGRFPSKWRKHSDRSPLRRELNAKSILFGFGLDSDAIHSPNEHYGLFNFFKGIETIPYFYANYSKLK